MLQLAARRERGEGRCILSDRPHPLPPAPCFYRCHHARHERAGPARKKGDGEGRGNCPHAHITHAEHRSVAAVRGKEPWQRAGAGADADALTRSHAAPPRELYNTLSQAKFSPEFWTSLGATDALEYDHKGFVGTTGAGSMTRFGTSAVLMPLQGVWPRCNKNARVFSSQFDNSVRHRQ
jgi:hypothetical protein